MEQTEETVKELLAVGRIEELDTALNSVSGRTEHFVILRRLADIYRIERQNGVTDTVFSYSTDIEQLSEHFTKIKLWLRRIEFDMPKESIDEFADYCEQTKASVYLLASLILVNMFAKEKVCKGLIQLAKERKKKEGSGVFCEPFEIYQGEEPWDGT